MANYKRIYAENHYVFITVVTYNRNKILINNIDLLKTSFKIVKKQYAFEIFGIVILPDHFHMIIKPDNPKELSKIIGNIKRNFTKLTSVGCAPRTNIQASRLNRREKTIWQRRFYEHTIRNESELYRFLNYIHYNPIKHGYVKQTIEWEPSSFHKFLKMQYYEKNWGNNNEEIKILLKMELE